MPNQSSARQRLAALMDRRRVDLGLTWQRVSERGDVSLRALHSVRSGDNAIRALTQAAIEKGLGWRSGSIETILGGGDPVPTDSPPAPVSQAALDIASLTEGFDPDAVAALGDQILQTVQARRDELGPGGKLTGAMIFSDARSAAIWDYLAAGPEHLGFDDRSIAKWVATDRLVVVPMLRRQTDRQAGLIAQYAGMSQAPS